MHYIRIAILFMTIFFSGLLYGQFTAKPVRETVSNMKMIQVSLPAPVKSFASMINLQETVSFNYIRKKLTLFLSAENILNEIFKPDPVVDGPVIEKEETLGNTGFIKLGVTINLRFN